MESTIEERFNAAVNVIKNLPKNGAYQPSTAILLSFYSYFKQATLGPCKQKKPPFWDVIGRTKWDSWKALGDMSKDRAMQLYVEELKKIIETMSFNENVADFVGSLGELANIDFNDLETVAPEAPVIRIARTHPDSPYASRASSPVHGMPTENGISLNGNDMYLLQNGHSSGVEQSDDEYIDTVEDNIESSIQLTGQNQSYGYANYDNNKNNATISHSDSSYEFTRGNLKDNLSSSFSNITANQVVLQQILTTVQNMNADVETVKSKMTILEKQFADMQKSSSSKISRHSNRKNPSWWPFNDISPTWFIFLILWPFLAQRLGRMLQRKK